MIDDFIYKNNGWTFKACKIHEEILIEAKYKYEDVAFTLMMPVIAVKALSIWIDREEKQHE